MADEQERAEPLAYKRPCKALLFEDNSDDAELCLRMLRKTSLDIQVDVASTLPDFAGRLHATDYDIVLSDYNLGQWTALDALDLLRNEQHDIPFILVTGSIGDTRAVECIKAGISDYILKDRLERLPLAISRALQEKSVRDERVHAESLLRESETRFRVLAEAIPAAMFVEQAGRFTYANPAAEDLTGYDRAELLAMHFAQIVHPESREAFAEHAAKRPSTQSLRSGYELKVLSKSKEVRWLDVATAAFEQDGKPASLIVALDVTDRKRVEHTIQYDLLTGLANREHLAEVFAREAMRTSRTDRPFSLLFLTLDGMKQIIYKYGALASNRALSRFANTMRLHSRAIDTYTRIGDAEFAAILPETLIEGAVVLGCKIARRLAADTEEPALSCSIGTAMYPRDGADIEEVLKAASNNRNLPASSEAGKVA